MKKNCCRLLFFSIYISTALFIPAQQPANEQKIDEYIRPYTDTKNFNGTVLVAKNNRIIYHKAFGLADQDFNIPNTTATVYHIASVSKMFTATAILLLKQRGLLSLADTVSRYVPELSYGNKITIHHLLIHSTGIPNINAMPVYDTVQRFTQTPQSLIRYFNNKPLTFTPGEKYSYSNSNYNILALIIEKISGRSFGDFLSENIFKPAGMNHTGHHANPAQLIQNCATGYQGDNKFGLEKATVIDWSSKTGNGSLYTTTEDLFKWHQALNTEKILHKDSKEKMFTKYIEATGYGCFIREHFNRTRFYMNGRSPGFSSYFVRYPADDLSIVILANNYIPVTTQMGMDIAAILFGENYEIPKLSARKIDENMIKKLTGRYQFDKNFFRPDFIMTVAAKDGILSIDWGELIPVSELVFIERNFWGELVFEQDEKGGITGLKYGDSPAKKLQ